MKKSLAFIISNLAGGGAQRVVSKLSFELSSYYNLYIILHDGEKINYPYKGQLIDLETPVGSGFIKKIAVFIIRIFKLKAIKGRVKPDAVISFLEGSNFINLLAKGDSKTLISVRNFKSKQASGFLGKLFSFMIKALYNKSDLIITPTKSIKDDLIKNFTLEEEKIKVINNPYNLDYIIQKSNEKLNGSYRNLFGQHPVLITVGSMMKQKGQWHLIRAFTEIKKSMPGVKLLILGEGELRPYLEKMVLDLGLKDDVIMPGFKNNPFKYINRSSVFVLPSLFEGFPNALVEAMACEVPVIAADCPSGPREILAPLTDFKLQTEHIEWAKYGVLVPVCCDILYQEYEPLSEKEKLIAEAVIKLLEDQSLCKKYKQASLVRVRDFESSSIVKQWVDILNV